MMSPNLRGRARLRGLGALLQLGWPWLLAVLAASAPLTATAAAPGSNDVAPAVAPLETLTYPAALPNLSTAPHTVEVNLTATPTTLSQVPGKPARYYTYNGSIPGPTLEVREGDHVIVHFHNNLPESTTIHWHGLHVPVQADGNPMDPVPPGGSYDYVFTVLPGQSGTYWYHPTRTP